MDSVACPHCKKHQFELAAAPRDVIVVMPCPKCSELTVLFRNKIIALSRRILERGSFDERKEHLSHVIAEFLEMGIFPKALGTGFFHAYEEGSDDSGIWQEGADESYFDGPDAPGSMESDEEVNPITQQELDRFVRTDLKCIDSNAYFRKHFQ